MSFSNNYETLVLQWALAPASSPTRASATYIGLYTAAPGEAGGGTEVSGGSYVRESVTFTVSGDTASNDATIEFTAATAAWGTITHVAVLDAVSGGGIIAYAALDVTKVIGIGDILRFNAGDIDVTLD